MVKRGKVTGVECTNGETFNADIVISNAGIKRTVELAGAKSFPEEYVEYVKGLKYSYSYITKKYGLSHRALDVKVPCIFNTPLRQCRPRCSTTSTRAASPRTRCSSCPSPPSGTSTPLPRASSW